MDLSNQQYDELAKQASHKSRSFIQVPCAFAFGGLICVAGQWFINIYSNMGVDDKMASSLGSATLIALAVIFTGFAIFDKLAKIAGAGTLVPITGFANAMSSAAIEFRSEGLIMGIGGKLFTIVGPVLAYGYSAGVIYGALYLLWQSLPDLMLSMG